MFRQAVVPRADGADLLRLSARLSSAASPPEVLDATSDFCRARLGADLVTLLMPADGVVPYVRTWTTDPGHTWQEVPLLSGDLRPGLLRLRWPADSPPYDAALELAAAVGVLCAGALHRAVLTADAIAARARAESAAERLRTLQRVAADLAEVVSVPDACRIVLDAVVGVLGADAATLNLLDDQRREFRQLAALGLDGSPIATWSTWRLADSLLAQEVMRTRRPVLVESAEERDRRFPDLAAMNVGQESWVNLPLVTGNAVSGLASFGWREQRRFDQDDVALLQALSDHLAAAVERSRLSEVNESLIEERTWVASTLQRSLLPPPLPRWDGLELAAGYEPALSGTQVCGDFYDAFVAPDDSLIVVIGDVAGRGIEAAGLTGLARHTLRALAADMPPPEALRRLNDAVMDSSRGGDQRLLTAAVIRLCQIGDVVEARIALGGHCLPVLVRDRTAQHVASPGVLLGAVCDPYISDTTVMLEPGDLLMLHTDGVIEARRHGVDFGEERLLRLLSAISDPSPQDVVDRVLGAVRWYRTTAPDDVAVLAMRVND